LFNLSQFNIGWIFRDIDTMAANARANAVILGAAAGLAVAGFVNPIPLLDGVYIATAWAGMLASLAPICGVKFDKTAFMTAIKAVFFSLGAYLVGVYAFLTIIKWTGVGTFPAAIVNAALNFSFTVGVGKVYENAWSEGREPGSDEIASQFRTMIDLVKKMDKETRTELKEKYDRLRAEGASQKDALSQVLAEYFGFE
jgi:uncharacterized protein (DUF697 family)